MTHTPIPSGYDIQPAAQSGLAITSPSERELFKLDSDGTLLDINHFLRSNMPSLFNHLAKTKIYRWILEVNRSTWTGNDPWPYVLLARKNRSLVPALLPNGRGDPTVSDLRDNCGRKGGPHSEWVLFFGEISHRKHSHTPSLTYTGWQR